VNRLLFALLLVAVTVVAGVSAEAAPSRGALVVSFTFGGTDETQDEFAEMLSEHGYAGTFYINSGMLGRPGRLSVDQLHNIARDRSEVGGASVSGEDLTGLSTGDAGEEICNDRTTLAQLGFQVTSFAYPQGGRSADVEAGARDCGYNSGRDFGGLYQSAKSCSDCPAVEDLPPADGFGIRTVGQPATLDGLKQQVLRAEQESPGWLPLVFGRLCLCPVDDGSAITRADFLAFLDWLSLRPVPVEVRTVDQVIGGTLKPVHGNALDRLVPSSSRAISDTGPLSKAPAWTVLGVEIGQAQILFLGIAFSLTVVITYRLATRRDRYAS